MIEENEKPTLRSDWAARSRGDCFFPRGGWALAGELFGVERTVTAPPVTTQRNYDAAGGAKTTALPPGVPTAPAILIGATGAPASHAAITHCDCAAGDGCRRARDDHDNSTAARKEDENDQAS